MEIEKTSSVILKIITQIITIGKGLVATEEDQEGTASCSDFIEKCGTFMASVESKDSKHSSMAEDIVRMSKLKVKKCTSEEVTNLETKTKEIKTAKTKLVTKIASQKESIKATGEEIDVENIEIKVVSEDGLKIKSQEEATKELASKGDLIIDFIKMKKVENSITILKTVMQEITAKEAGDSSCGDIILDLTDFFAAVEGNAENIQEIVISIIRFSKEDFSLCPDRAGDGEERRGGTGPGE